MGFDLQKNVNEVLSRDPNCPLALLSDTLRRRGWGGERTELEDALKDRAHLQSILNEEATMGSDTALRERVLGVEDTRQESARQMVERLLNENDGMVKNETLRDELAKTGRFKASTIQQTISTVRSRLKKSPARPVYAATAVADDEKFDSSELLEVKKVIDRLGGLQRLRRATDFIEQLCG